MEDYEWTVEETMKINKLIDYILSFNRLWDFENVLDLAEDLFLRGFEL